MKAIKNFLPVLFLVASQMVFAGHEFGNGGGVVVCRRPVLKTIKSVELLDFYEARIIRKVPVDLGAPNLDWKAKVELLLKRLRPVSEFRYQLYSRWFSTFEAEALFIKDANFTTIEDTAHVAIPTHCQFEQAAVQKTPQFPNDPRYYLNQNLWDHMNSDQRAGLVMHELIYREAMSYGHEYSTSARYLLSQLVNPEFSKFKMSEYFNLLSLANFEVMDIPVHYSVKQLISLDRFWQLPKFETSVGRMEIENHILYQVGKCANANCTEFIKDDNFERSLSCFEASNPADSTDCFGRLGGILAFGTSKIVTSDYQFNLISCKKSMGPTYFNLTMSAYRKMLGGIDTYNTTPFTGLCEGKFQVIPTDPNSILKPTFGYGETNIAVLKSIEFAKTYQGLDYLHILLLEGSVYENLNGQLSPLVSLINSYGCQAEVAYENSKVTDLQARTLPTSAGDGGDSNVCYFKFRNFGKQMNFTPTSAPERILYISKFDERSAPVEIDGTVSFSSLTAAEPSDYGSSYLNCEKREECISISSPGASPSKARYALSEGAKYYSSELQRKPYLIKSGEFEVIDGIPAGLKMAADAEVELVDGTKVAAKAGSTLVFDKKFKVRQVIGE